MCPMCAGSGDEDEEDEGGSGDPDGSGSAATSSEELEGRWRINAQPVWPELWCRWASLESVRCTLSNSKPLWLQLLACGMRLFCILLSVSRGAAEPLAYEEEEPELEPEPKAAAQPQQAAMAGDAKPDKQQQGVKRPKPTAHK